MNVYEKTYLFLFIEHQPVSFGQGSSATKDIQSIKFYGVDYSQAKVFGAKESPYEFKLAFRRINELFIAEAKKYDVGKQLKKEVSEISLEAVNKVNEAINPDELFTSRTQYTLTKEQVNAAIQALPIPKEAGVGMAYLSPSF